MPDVSRVEREMTMKRTTILLASAALLVGLTAAGAARADDDDPYCREYTRDVKIGGYIEKAFGTACQMPDGSWQLQPDQSSPGAHGVRTVRREVIVDEDDYYPDRHYAPVLIIVGEPIYRRPFYRPYYGHPYWSHYHGHGYGYGHRGRAYYATPGPTSSFRKTLGPGGGELG